MENTNPLTPPVSRRVRKLNNLLESLEKIIPPPTDETSYLEEEPKIEPIGENELEEEFEEEYEEEEDDLEYFDTFPTREDLEYHESILKNPRPLGLELRLE
ncbi:hypothetical protein Tco_1140742 [Tanacetum coccineum]